MRYHRGVTLVEVLVTLVVLGIGLISVVQCLNAALIAHTRANRIALATTIAQTEIENMRSMNLYEPCSMTLRDYLEASGNAAEFDKQVLLPKGEITVDVADYDTALKLRSVRVEVSWQGYRRERVVIETLVSNRQRHSGG